MGGAVGGHRLHEARAWSRATPRASSGIETGDLTVVGVNRWTETEPSPLTAGEGAIMVVDPAMEAEQIERLKAWRAAARRQGGQGRARRARSRPPRKAATSWSRRSLRQAPASPPASGAERCAACSANTAPRPASRSRPSPATAPALDDVRASVDALSAKLGRRIKFLVGKPGLDGHSNGAEQIAVRARDVGMEVVYEGIRLTPAQIVRAAVDESAHVVGLSILSGSHVPLVRDVMERMRKEGLGDVPVVVGGIIPPEDEATLKAFGVAAVYTPKNFQLNDIMADIVRLVAGHAMAA